MVDVQNDIFMGYRRDELAEVSEMMHEQISSIEHPVTRAINYAAFSSYAQYYFDGNKRTARHMMDGELMAFGYDAVPIPYSKVQQYTHALAAMFRTGELRPYARFLLSCLVHQTD